jgi:hypothetical protein
MYRILELPTDDAEAVPMESGRALRNACANQRFGLSKVARDSLPCLLGRSLDEGESEVEWDARRMNW